MIKDLVYTDTNTYSKVVKKFFQKVDFEDRDGCMFSLSEVYNLAFCFDILPNVDKYSMGEFSGIIAIHKQTFSLGKSYPIINIYDAQSKPLRNIILNAHAHDAFVHVLPNDDVVCITDEGDLFTYRGAREISHISLQSMCRGNIIMQTSFSSSSFICFISNGDVFEVQDYKNPVLMHHFNDLGKPNCVAVIPHERSTNQATKVLMLKDGNLVIFDDLKQYEIKMQKKIISVATSYTCDKVALLLEDFTLIVCNQVMDQTLYEVKIDTYDMKNFISMKWLGDVAPVIAFENAVIIGVIDENSPVLFVNGNAEIFTESDSVYVITQTQSYRISYIEENVSLTLNEYANSDSCKLCKIFDKRLTDPFVEAISKIENVSGAIKDIIDTAGSINDTEVQCYFVAAACFANAYSNKGKSDKIGKINEKLKIMNALHSNGIPITSKQLAAISTDDILTKLCSRNLYNLAFSIANFIKYKTSNIADQLVMDAVDGLQDDNAVITQIPLNLIRPAFAAEYALNVNRVNLAIKFAELEEDMRKKCVLFAKMGEWRQALQAAEETCDSSCLMDVLKEALKSDKVDEVNSAIVSCNSAIHMLAKLEKLTTEQRLQDIFDKIQPTDEAYDVNKIFNLSQNGLMSTIDSCSSMKKLWEAQMDIIEKTGDRTIEGMTLYDTIRTLLSNNRKEDAKKIAKKCSVDSKRMAMLKFETYVANKRWAALRKFGVKRKRRDMWPSIVLMMSRESEGLARSFIDEIGTIDPKAMTQILSDFESGALTADSTNTFKPICCIFNS